jgi:hypothetical protein
MPDPIMQAAAPEHRRDPMDRLTVLALGTWQPEVSAAVATTCAQTIESGGVLSLPRLAFRMTADEARFLDPRWSDGRAKNISLDGTEIRGSSARGADRVALRDMIARFAQAASGLVAALVPRYAQHQKHARTSFRPLPASGRAVSWRKDDTRLHVDAFESRPNHGERILRVFCNVNPDGVDRVWRIGEPFDAMAARFLPAIRPMRAGEAGLLAALHVTRGRRSEYDHLMLGLHDAAKGDLEYQRCSTQQEVRFTPGTTWICFSDQVMHAAMGGQYMLEQTIHLPLEALHEPLHAPLAILERLTGRRLVAQAH